MKREIIYQRTEHIYECDEEGCNGHMVYNKTEDDKYTSGNLLALRHPRWYIHTCNKCGVMEKYFEKYTRYLGEVEG